MTMHTATPNFRFQRFTVWHDHCAMRVGTDGVLIGAWAPLPDIPSVHILDIGTGSGLIALMLAQRCEQAGKTFHIQAIDIDPNATAQAMYNFQLSPWTGYLHVSTIPLQAYASPNLFHLIVSNPPFFNHSLRNPDASKAAARHTDSLTYTELIHHAAALLEPQGILALILPAETEETIQRIATLKGLTTTHITHVHSKPGKPTKRILVTFRHAQRAAQPTLTDTFYIESADAPRSPEYQQLTRDFYLPLSS